MEESKAWRSLLA